MPMTCSISPTSILPLFAYAVFGKSRTLSVGPVAVVSLMTASAAGAVAAPGSAEYWEAAITLAALSGVMLVVLGLLRLLGLLGLLGLLRLGMSPRAAEMSAKAGPVDARGLISVSSSSLLQCSPEAFETIKP